MMFLRHLCALWSLWQPRHVVEPAPADDGIVADPLKIRRLLGELAQSGTLLSLQDRDGRSGFGRLVSLDARSLCIRAQEADAAAQLTTAPLNVNASTSCGVLLFTLETTGRRADGLLQAPWPRQLIAVQSRRHFRVCAVQGRQHRASLVSEAASGALCLHDLSEEGVAFDVAPGSWTHDSTLARLRLVLDEQVVQVPLLQVVHSRSATGGQRWRIGARLMGVSAPDLRALRRWLAAAQASSPALPATQRG